MAIELDNIKLQTTWNDAAASLNNNFNKLKNVVGEGIGYDIVGDEPETPDNPYQPIVVDSEMSDTSTNPVQNKVVKKYVDDKHDELAVVLDWFEFDDTDNMIHAKFGLYSDGNISASGKNEDDAQAGITYEELEEYLVEEKYARQEWVESQSYATEDSVAVLDEKYDALDKRVTDIEENGTGSEGKIEVDEALSETSENPVQNKVITLALKEKASISYVDEKVANIKDSALEWFEFDEAEGMIKAKYGLYSDYNITAGGKSTSSSDSGINYDDLEEYLVEEKYAKQDWVENQSYATADELESIETRVSKLETSGGGSGATLTKDGIISALEYTPMDVADFTKANIKSTLGIYDWALSSTKPEYTYGEIQGDLEIDKIKIGEATLSWDAEDEVLKIDKDVYSEKSLSAGGKSDREEEIKVNNLAINFRGLSDYVDRTATAAEIARCGLDEEAVERLLEGIYNKVVNDGTLRQVWNYSADETETHIRIYFSRGDGFDVSYGYCLEQDKETKDWTVTLGEI